MKENGAYILFSFALFLNPFLVLVRISIFAANFMRLFKIGFEIVILMVVDK